MVLCDNSLIDSCEASNSITVFIHMCEARQLFSTISETLQVCALDQRVDASPTKDCMLCRRQAVCSACLC